jgi:hypothetical protein
MNIKLNDLMGFKTFYVILKFLFLLEILEKIIDWKPFKNISKKKIYTFLFKDRVIIWKKSSKTITGLWFILISLNASKKYHQNKCNNTGIIIEHKMGQWFYRKKMCTKISYSHKNHCFFSSNSTSFNYLWSTRNSHFRWTELLTNLKKPENNLIIWCSHSGNKSALRICHKYYSREYS